MALQTFYRCVRKTESLFEAEGVFIPPFAIVCDIHSRIFFSPCLYTINMLEDHPTIRLSTGERRVKQVSLLEPIPISLVLAATWSITIVVLFS